MTFIFEKLLLEYSEKTKKDFYDIFTNGDEKAGKELLGTFDRSKQLLLNNNISNDIQKWIADAKKDPSKVEELKNILHNLSTRKNRIDKSMDIRKNKVPGKYKILWQGDGTTLYRIDDVVASMALGVNTGWCTTGRYRHYGDPNFVPSEKDAMLHFGNHMYLSNGGVGKLYYLVDDKTGYGLYAWHFRADEDGYFEEYTQFDDKDNTVNDVYEEVPENGLEKIMYDDFMENLQDCINSIPDFLIAGGELVRFIEGNDVAVIPDGVTAIGDDAFEECWVTEVIVPEGVKSIGDRAFTYCNELEYIELPDSLTSIGRSAFFSCYYLEDIAIPDNVTSIGDKAFSYCSRLKSITIPEGMSSINDQTFYGCRELKSATIPNSVTHIGYGAFEGCDKLESVTIGKGVTSIGPKAFYGCNRLIDVYYAGSEKDWKNIEMPTLGNNALLRANIHLSTV